MTVGTTDHKARNPLPYSDFRSDTATAPTADMFRAMMKSSLGDDVYNEDDSVKKLERYVAALCGQEAALYCSSGTMTNQLALRVHLSNPPQSAMVDIRSHVFNYEAGGISFHSQAAVYPVMPSNGKYLTAEDVASKMILDVDVHYAPTRVVSLENTLNGTIMPIEEMERIRALTREHGIKLHLDGARLWHASMATGISMKEYCSHFDSVSLCLSKGIGAPIGSILVGSAAVIKKARHFRLLFGGGWRQAGFLAEAALWGIKNNWPTMEDTHRQAKWLERVFLQIGCKITNPVETNMVWVDTTDAGFTVDELMAELAKEGIKISGSGCAARIVLHYQITDEAVERFIEVLRKMASSPRMKVSVELTKAQMRDRPHSVYDDEEEVDESDVDEDDEDEEEGDGNDEEELLQSLQPKEANASSSTPSSPPTGVTAAAAAAVAARSRQGTTNSTSTHNSHSTYSQQQQNHHQTSSPAATPSPKSKPVYDEKEVARRHASMGVPNFKQALFKESHSNNNPASPGGNGGSEPTENLESAPGSVNGAVQQQPNTARRAGGGRRTHSEDEFRSSMSDFQLQKPPPARRGSHGRASLNSRRQSCMLYPSMTMTEEEGMQYEHANHSDEERDGEHETDDARHHHAKQQQLQETPRQRERDVHAYRNTVSLDMQELDALRNMRMGSPSSSSSSSLQIGGLHHGQRMAAVTAPEDPVSPTTTEHTITQERPHTADKEKKKNKSGGKLQYRLSNNTASKAIKRASVRIARWSTMLSREA
ncbi:Threonine aldolase [Actinomortierella wolfii]|nr:Threonine aldolase [Actinomortierella wolfii]